MNDETRENKNTWDDRFRRILSNSLSSACSIYSLPRPDEKGPEKAFIRRQGLFNRLEQTVFACRQITVQVDIIGVVVAFQASWYGQVSSSPLASQSTS